MNQLMRMFLAEIECDRTLAERDDKGDRSFVTQQMH
jgi:hypothetical protein